MSHTERMEETRKTTKLRLKYRKTERDTDGKIIW